MLRYITGCISGIAATLALIAYALHRLDIANRSDINPPR